MNDGTLTRAEVVEYLTRKEAAAMFKLPLRTLDYLVGTNQIPFSRLGRRNVRFSKKRLEEWFKEREGVEYRITQDSASG